MPRDNVGRDARSRARGLPGVHTPIRVAWFVALIPAWEAVVEAAERAGTPVLTWHEIIRAGIPCLARTLLASPPLVGDRHGVSALVQWARTPLGANSGGSIRHAWAQWVYSAAGFIGEIMRFR